jgi:hypothetical protein
MMTYDVIKEIDDEALDAISIWVAEYLRTKLKSYPETYTQNVIVSEKTGVEIATENISKAKIALSVVLGAINDFMKKKDDSINDGFDKYEKLIEVAKILNESPPLDMVIEFILQPHIGSSSHITRENVLDIINGVALTYQVNAHHHGHFTISNTIYYMIGFNCAMALYLCDHSGLDCKHFPLPSIRQARKLAEIVEASALRAGKPVVSRFAEGPSISRQLRAGYNAGVALPGHNFVINDNC